MLEDCWDIACFLWRSGDTVETVPVQLRIYSPVYTVASVI